MQIFVKARSFLEGRQGTRQERQLFRDNRIIFIDSVSFPVEEPPFSEEFLNAENLLVVYFDDVAENFPNAMTPEQARAIVDFVCAEDDRPIIVYCTAGISRSGAVGEVLNWYFNRYLADNQSVYSLNEVLNRGIVPNAHVRRLLLAELQHRHGNLSAMVKKIRLRQLRKRLQYLLNGVCAEKKLSEQSLPDEYVKNLECIRFSEKVIAGNPEVTKLAKAKFLHSRYGVTAYNGHILVADIKGDGKLPEIFSAMLAMATPESYAVKADDPETFFAPFREYFKARIYEHSNRLLQLGKNDPQTAALFLLVNERFEHLNMFSKHCIYQRAQKFDALAGGTSL